jgi:hypothetical protein
LDYVRIKITAWESASGEVIVDYELGFLIAPDPRIYSEDVALKFKEPRWIETSSCVVNQFWRTE